MATLWVTVPCAYLYSDMETAAGWGLRLGSHGCQKKASADGFYLEILGSHMHGVLLLSRAGDQPRSLVE